MTNTKQLMEIIMFNAIQFKIDNANSRIQQSRDAITALQHARMGKDAKKYMVKHYQERIKAEEQFIREISQNIVAA